MSERNKIIDYTVSAETSTNLIGRVAEGDTLSMIVTGDDEGSLSGYVLHPDGMHYVTGYKPEAKADEPASEGSHTAPDRVPEFQTAPANEEGNNQ